MSELCLYEASLSIRGMERKKKRLPNFNEKGYNRETDPEDHYSIREQYSDSQDFDSNYP